MASDDAVQNTFANLLKGVSSPPTKALYAAFKNDLLFLYQKDSKALALVLDEAFTKPRAAAAKAKGLPTAQQRLAACKDWIDRLKSIDKKLGELRERGLEEHWQHFRSTLNHLVLKIRAGDLRRYKL